MVGALRLARAAAALTHAHVISDVGAGTGLLDGALKAVLLNVDINLPSLANPEMKKVCGEERAALAKEGEEIAREVLAMVAGRLATGS